MEIERHLQKERKGEIIKVIEERESLLKRIVSLKRINEKVTAPWITIMLDELANLRKEKEYLLSNQEFEKEGSIVRQVQSYKTILFENNEDEDVGSFVFEKNKRKKKVIGIAINEPI